MSTDGKQLEALVAFVERELLPPGFSVTPNERIYVDGIQVAEFDIDIYGRIGSTTIHWLIECRDRPGQGPAPGSWIEQLVGRRTRFGFNKVTAVSTTGFAAGAVAFAQQQGIELREVASLDPSEFTHWLRITAASRIQRFTGLKHAHVLVSSAEPDDLRNAAMAVVSQAASGDRILKSSSTGTRCNLAEAFRLAAQTTNAFDEVEAGATKEVRIKAAYSDDDHYLLETSAGLVRVQRIEFLGELRIEETLVPVVKTAEYRHAETGEAISQLAAFAPQSLFGMTVELGLHRIAESGETHVVLRRLPDA